MKAKSTFTYNSIIGDIRTRLQSYTDEKFPKQLIFKEIYNALCELHELSADKSEPMYRDFDVIPTLKSVQSDGDASTLVYYTKSTKGLYVPLTADDQTVNWTGDTDGFDSSWVGATVYMEHDDYPPGSAPIGGHNKGYYATIQSVTDATHVILTTPSPEPSVDLNGDGFRVTITLANAQANKIDISDLASYKFIDRITSIEDSITGQCIEVSEKDFLSIKRFSSDENNYSEDIVWYRHGEFINFCRGQLVSQYGIRTMNYTRNPIKPTAYTDYVDIPDNSIKILKDMVCLVVLQGINAPIPQDLAQAEAKIGAMRQAIANERAKLDANIKTSS